MKKTIILSSLVITQAILASTLNIYSSNLTYVNETRDLNIDAQTNEFSYNNIPNSIISESADIDLPSSVTLYTQTYKNNQLSTQKLAKSFINKSVKYNKQYVTLLSVDGDNATIQRQSKRISIVDLDDIEFEFVPKNLTLTPKITYKIKTDTTINTKIELNYLTKGISFHNDYTLYLYKDDAKLKAWANISNHSGKDFYAADITLVAGEIHKRYRSNYPVVYKSNTVSDSAPIKEIEPTPTNGYYTYDLPYKIDLLNNEQTKVKLFDVDNLKIQNSYETRLSNPLYLFGERSSGVSRFIKFKLLDKIIPSGTIRVYSKEDKKTIFLGEDRVGNKAKDTEVSIKVGKDFDTKVTQNVVSREDTKISLSSTIKYTLRNSSNEKKMITLFVPFRQTTSSKIDSDIDYTKKNNDTLVFQVEVDPSSSKSFNVSYLSKRR
jgi:hypothetical protein